SETLKVMDKKDYEKFVTMSLQDCPESSKFKKQYTENKDKFLKDYMELILKSCKINDVNCNDCIWGGNHYDYILSKKYGQPIMSISVGNGDLVLGPKEYEVDG